MSLFFAEYLSMSLIFQWYFYLWSVMLGCKGKICGGSSYSGGFKELLYNGFLLWLGQGLGDNRVILRDTHVDHLDDNG